MYGSAARKRNVCSHACAVGRTRDLFSQRTALLERAATRSCAKRDSPSPKCVSTVQQDAPANDLRDLA